MGNKAFNEKKYDIAIELYSKGLKINCKEKYLLYYKRSIVYNKIKKYKKAILDAINCCLENPSWYKGWLLLSENLREIYHKDAYKCLLRSKELQNQKPNITNLIKKISTNKYFIEKLNDKDYITKIDKNKKNPFALLKDPKISNLIREIIKDIN